MFNYFKQVGATIGSAVVGSIFTLLLTGFVHDNLTDVMLQMAFSGAVMGHRDTAAMNGAMHLSASNLTPSGVNALPGMLRTPIIDAYNSALLPIFMWMVPFMIVAVIVFFFVRQKELSTTLER